MIDIVLLEEVYLSGCKKLTDDSIEHLAGTCGSTLKVLVIKSLKKLTSWSLEALAKFCTCLEVINMTGCIRLDLKGVNHLINKSKSLKCLTSIGLNKTKLTIPEGVNVITSFE